MIRKMIAIAAVAGMLGAVPAMAANQCRDAHGKFTKCAAVTKSTATTKIATPGVTKGKDGKCRLSSGPKKGQFTKCP